jgi:hypothetical protein
MKTTDILEHRLCPMVFQFHATWGELLHSEVHMAGKTPGCYTAFHNYTFGNALLALEQCIIRKI